MDNSEAEQEEAQHPVGFRFMPTDEEIVLYYLKKQPCKFDLAKAVHSVDVYDYDPWTLQSIYGMKRVKETYFITHRNKKYPGGARPDRAAGDGFWKATGNDHKVKSECGEELGSVRKTLVYYIKNKEEGAKPIKTNWIMQEYRLGEPGEAGSKKAKNPEITRLDGQVVCKIYERTPGKKEVNQGDKVMDEEMELGLQQQAQEVVQFKDEPMELGFQSDGQMELGFHSDGMISRVNSDQASSIGSCDILTADLYGIVTPIATLPPLPGHGEQHADFNVTPITSLPPLPGHGEQHADFNAGASDDDIFGGLDDIYFY